jgi:hypothetical protein
MIRHKIQESHTQLNPAVSLSLRLDELDFEVKKGIHILVVVQWSFHGLQHYEKLMYAATRLDEAGGILAYETAERLANLAISRGEDWLEARNLVDLRNVYHIANDILFGDLEEQYQMYIDELKAKNEDRADIQLHNLEEHYRRQSNKFREIRDTHALNQREALVKATEGRLQVLERRIEQMKMKINAGREVRCDTKELAIAIIELR